jgi:hypothetical protein
MKTRLTTILFLISSLSLLSTRGWTKSSDFFKRAGLGLEIGSWKPNALKREATVSPFGVSGASPFFRISLNSPQFRNWTLRASGGYWAQMNIKNVPQVQSLTILLMMLDLKERIIPQSRLTPFVSYGVTILMGRESPDSAEYRPWGGPFQFGYGINVGAGFDFYLRRHWLATTEFCYHYVRFSQPLGGLNDYSGPKISIGFAYLF